MDRVKKVHSRPKRVGNPPRKSLALLTVPKQRRKAKPGTRALKEIRKLQNSTDLLIPKKSFNLLVRDIAQQVLPVIEGLRFEVSALQAMQEAAEAHLVQMFEKSQRAAIHAKRVTLLDRDIHLYKAMRGE